VQVDTPDGGRDRPGNGCQSSPHGGHDDDYLADGLGSTMAITDDVGDVVRANSPRLPLL